MRINSNKILPYLLIAPILFIVFCCDSGSLRDKKKGQGSGCSRDTTEVIIPDTVQYTYNFLIENSKSMKGFFYKKSQLEDVLKILYDRISENHENDTITLNSINRIILNYDKNITDYLNSAESFCEEKQTKLDEILTLAIDTLKENQVNLLISDFTFSSAQTSLEGAKSEITKIFTQRLNKDKDLSLAILQYNCDFKGTYYPGISGSFQCNQKIPVYIWVFGPNNIVKEIIELRNIKDPNIMCLQNPISLEPEFEVKNKRMIDKTDNSVRIKDWKSERNNDNYKLKFNVDLAGILAIPEYITDTNNYEITGPYKLESVEVTESQIYQYTITTDRPTPGIIYLNCKNNIPKWVSESNYSGTVLPPSGKTENIFPLIEGVYDAFNKDNNKFSIKINIK